MQKFYAVLIFSRVVPDLTISNRPEPEPDSGKTCFGITEMKLMASTMLTAAIKRQYSSVLLFYPLDAMLERVFVRATCLSGCLAGCPSQPVLYQNGNS